MLLQFLKRLGFQFDMDWDDEVTITAPDVVLRGDLMRALEPFEYRLADQVRFRARKQRAVFVGGTLNGQMIGERQCLWAIRGHDGKVHRWIVHHVSRGRWECYDQEEYNGRAFFRGHATNKHKAKRGEIVERPATSHND